MKKSDIKSIILSFSLLASLVATDIAFAEEVNDLNKISFNKLSDDVIEIRLETEKPLPGEPIVYERGKNVYFIALNSTSYNGDRKIDIKNFEKQLSAATVDYIPYKSQDSGYTRILIKTQDDIKIKTVNTIKNKGKLVSFLSKNTLSQNKELKYYLLKILQMLGACVIVITAGGITYLKLKDKKKISEVLDAKDVEIDIADSEQSDVESVDFGNFVAASSIADNEVAEDKDEDISNQSEILDNISFEDDTIPVDTDAVGDDTDNAKAELENVSDNVEEDVAVVSDTNDIQVVSEDNAEIDENNQVEFVSSDNIAQEEDDSTFDELIKEGEEVEQLLESDESISDEEIEDDIIDDSQDVVADDIDISDSSTDEADDDNDSNNNYETAKYIATSGSGVFVAKTFDFSKPAENEQTENLNSADNENVENDDDIIYEENTEEEVPVEETNDIVVDNDSNIIIPVNQTVSDEDFDTATPDDIDEYLPDNPEDEISSEYSIGGFDSIIASVPDDNEIEKLLSGASEEEGNSATDEFIDENLSEIDSSEEDVVSSEEIASAIAEEDDVAQLFNSFVNSQENEIQEDNTNVVADESDEFIEPEKEETEETIDSEPVESAETVEEEPEEVVEETTDALDVSQLIDEFIEPEEEETKETVNFEPIESAETVEEEPEEVVEETADTLEVSQLIDEFIEPEEEETEETIDSEPVESAETVEEEVDEIIEAEIEPEQEAVGTQGEYEEEAADEEIAQEVVEEVVVDNGIAENEHAEVLSMNTESFFVEEEPEMEEYTSAPDNFYKDEPADIKSSSLTDEDEVSFFKDDTETEPTEPEFIDDSEPVVISNKELEDGKLLYLIRHEGQFSLIGIMNDDVFVLNRFAEEPAKTRINAKLNEEKEYQNIYIVKVDKWRALVSVTNNSMENLLTLS